MCSGTTCHATCPTPGGHSTCRPGYSCDIYVFDSDLFQGGCIPSCTSAADCMDTGYCNTTTGLCCGGVAWGCCAGNTCPLGGTCNTATGYCE